MSRTVGVPAEDCHFYSKDKRKLPAGAIIHDGERKQKVLWTTDFHDFPPLSGMYPHLPIYNMAEQFGVFLIDIFFRSY